MPELPELHGMSQVINSHAAGRIFFKCKTSSVTKLPRVKPPRGKFVITAQSRGKELMMSLMPVPQTRNMASAVYILCNMGMTGFFEAVFSHNSRHKHAHLSFYATDGSVLSFVDQRRFGTWRSMAAFVWPEDRGPDPVKEYVAFRLGVVAALAARPRSFDKKPICQVLHDQSLFNGIGNYLRAEILHRAGIPPFTCAKDVLMLLPPEQPKHECDLLTYCRGVPEEVINMHLSKYQGSSASASADTEPEHGRWKKWLRVYGHKDASWAVDKEGRRIWFQGPPGKLVHLFAKSCSPDIDGRLSSQPIRNSAITKKPAAGQGVLANRKTSTARLSARKTVLKKPSRSR